MTAEESATSGVRLVQVYLIVSRTGSSSQCAQKLAPAKADAKRAHRLATPQQVGWAKLAPAKAGAKRPSPLWRLAHAVRTRVGQRGHGAKSVPSPTLRLDDPACGTQVIFRRDFQDEVGMFERSPLLERRPPQAGDDVS